MEVEIRCAPICLSGSESADLTSLIAHDPDLCETQQAVSRKRKAKVPRRLRMNRAQRLQSARAWLLQQAGREPARIGASYRRWYGVDWFCVIEELSRLGVNFDPQWVEHLRSSLEGQPVARAAQGAANRADALTDGDADSDENFAFIAGYTPGGFPYGVTWAEWETQEQRERAGREPDPF